MTSKTGFVPLSSSGLGHKVLNLVTGVRFPVAAIYQYLPLCYYLVMAQAFNRKCIDGMWVYDIPDEICKEMFQEDEKYLERTYPKPDKVTRSVLTEEGNTYTGISYHTDVMTLTMHAEMTAYAHAVIHGERSIIAVTGPNCHMCKQLMWENAVRTSIDPTIIIITDGQYMKTRLSEMMIQGWPDRPGVCK